MKIPIFILSILFCAIIALQGWQLKAIVAMQSDIRTLATEAEISDLKVNVATLSVRLETINAGTLKIRN